MRDTSLLVIPVSPPSACTESSTLRIETPCSYASSPHRREQRLGDLRWRSSSDGKNDPARSCRVRSFRSPAVVVNVRGRLRSPCAVRSSVSWCGLAPVIELNSASIRAW